MKNEKNRKPSVICDEKEDEKLDGAFNYRKTSDTE